MPVTYNDGDVDSNGAEEVNLRTAAGVELLGQQTSAASLPVVIASDQSAVKTVPYPYTLADTNTLFTLSIAPSTTLGTTETALVLFKNPSGSGKTIKIKSISFGNFATVNSFIKFRLYKAPTVTANGTAITVSCYHIGNAAATVVTPFSMPTISANGTVMGMWGVGNPLATTGAVTIPEYQLLLDSNQNLLITGQADGTNRAPIVNIVWAEV